MKSNNVKRGLSIAIVGMMVFSLFVVLISIPSSPFIENVAGSVTGKAYGGSGDWIIDQDTTVQSESDYVINGNIKVYDGYTLTILDSTIKINTTIDSGYHFYHNATGNIIIRNSTITKGSSGFKWGDFVFVTVPQSNNIVIDNSTISYFRDFNLNRVWDLTIKNSEFENGRWAMRLETAGAAKAIQNDYFLHNITAGSTNTNSIKLTIYEQTINFTEMKFTRKLHLEECGGGDAVLNFTNSELPESSAYWTFTNDVEVYEWNTGHVKVVDGDSNPKSGITTTLKDSKNDTYSGDTDIDGWSNQTVKTHWRNSTATTDYNNFLVTLSGISMTYDNWDIQEGGSSITLNYDATINLVFTKSNVNEPHAPFSTYDGMFAYITNQGTEDITVTVKFERNSVTLGWDTRYVAAGSEVLFSVDWGIYKDTNGNGMVIRIDANDTIEEFCETDNNFTGEGDYRSYRFSGEHILGLQMDDIGVSNSVSTQWSELDETTLAILGDVLHQHNAKMDILYVFAYLDPSSGDITPLSDMISSGVISQNYIDIVKEYPELIPNVHGWTHSPSTDLTQHEFSYDANPEPSLEYINDRFDNITEEWNALFPGYNMTVMVMPGYHGTPDSLGVIEERGLYSVYASHQYANGTSNWNDSTDLGFGSGGFTRGSVFDIKNYAGNPESLSDLEPYIEDMVKWIIYYFNLGQPTVWNGHAYNYLRNDTGHWFEGYNGSLVLDAVLDRLEENYTDITYMSSYELAQMQKENATAGVFNNSFKVFNVGNVTKYLNGTLGGGDVNGTLPAMIGQYKIYSNGKVFYNISSVSGEEKNYDMGMKVNPSSSSIDITMNIWDLSNKDTYGTTIISFTANSIDGNNVTFAISGLDADKKYKIEMDGASFKTVRANESGVITFNNSDWSEHIFTISNYHMMDMIYPWISIILTVMMIVAVIGLVTKFGK